ncbi:MAG: nucleoside deaminase [Bdellovibrionota bacterium]
MDKQLLDIYMQQALLEAQRAFYLGEVPVGAVIYKEGEVVSRAYNQIETTNDATAHAEILAIKAASIELNNWRLNDCVLVSTLEPCTMCLGAIKQSRISTIIFGASDPRFGACGSLYNLAENTDNGPVPEVHSGVMAEECKNLIQEFFRKLRSK